MNQPAANITIDRRASLLARQLANFVDREAEMTHFERLLTLGEPNVFFICGESGIGKSSLLARMMHECSMRNCRKAEVVWSDTRSHSYENVMRKLRDDIGTAWFGPFNDLINFYTKNDYKLTINVEGLSTINVASGASIKNATVGDVGGIIIKDFMLNAPRTDMAVPDSERMIRLTERFLEDLRKAVEHESLVIFLDATEKMSADTERWLWGELMPPIRDRAIPNVSIVISGQRRPELSYDWQSAAHIAELRALELQHIAQYLDRRGVPASDVPALAKMLHVMTQGKVSAVAKYVEAYLRT
jgi:hypothetical protein